ncbi:hypothetical protein DW712_07765 [Bacteroides intestinalis]|uniref:Uncharacterized protein n=1 Tax=Bacteroides intestinalis TaxID=329854 RepID=A0A412XWQ3_9BACE|nr:hypothetical protein DWW10_20580 [Bacteroides intestinalis]RHA63664.1 hypothetical protein DW932_02340 [Bacteroides intestinalis]RHE93012.1 hypothetical protein DW712_07765 [Bacteroides intestinalis]
MVALMPGQSPPEVKIPILITILFLGNKLTRFQDTRKVVYSSCQLVNLLSCQLNTSVKIEKKEKKDREANK